MDFKQVAEVPFHIRDFAWSSTQDLLAIVNKDFLLSVHRGVADEYNKLLYKYDKKLIYMFMSVSRFLYRKIN